VARQCASGRFPTRPASRSPSPPRPSRLPSPAIDPWGASDRPPCCARTRRARTRRGRGAPSRPPREACLHDRALHRAFELLVLRGEAAQRVLGLQEDPRDLGGVLFLQPLLADPL